MALALSDWILAAAGLWGIWRLRDTRAALTRWLAWSGLLLLSLAAVLGGLRYMGNDGLVGWHRQFADLAAVLGLPLMMLALAVQRLTQARAQRPWLPAALLAVVVGSALTADRQLAGVISLGLLLLAALPRPRRIAGPLVIGGVLVLMGVWRQFEAVDLTQRLIVMHIALVGLLALWLREMGHVASMQVEETQQ